MRAFVAALECTAGAAKVWTDSRYVCSGVRYLDAGVCPPFAHRDLWDRAHRVWRPGVSSAAWVKAHLCSEEAAGAGSLATPPVTMAPLWWRMVFGSAVRAAGAHFPALEDLAEDALRAAGCPGPAAHRRPPQQRCRQRPSVADPARVAGQWRRDGLHPVQAQLQDTVAGQARVHLQHGEAGAAAGGAGGVGGAREAAIGGGNGQAGQWRPPPLGKGSGVRAQALELGLWNSGIQTGKTTRLRQMTSSRNTTPKGLSASRQS